jgi:hypothetical protein
MFSDVRQINYLNIGMLADEDESMASNVLMQIKLVFYKQKTPH